jgi:hypothetical protein
LVELRVEDVKDALTKFRVLKDQQLLVNGLLVVHNTVLEVNDASLGNEQDLVSAACVIRLEVLFIGASDSIKSGCKCGVYKCKAYIVVVDEIYFVERHKENFYH